jgi:hypothetical protein
MLTNRAVDTAMTRLGLVILDIALLKKSCPVPSNHERDTLWKSSQMRDIRDDRRKLNLGPPPSEGEIGPISGVHVTIATLETMRGLNYFPGKLEKVGNTTELAKRLTIHQSHV